MKLDKVIRKLEEALKKPLPGKMGQGTMAPKPIDARRFSLNIPENHRKGAVLMLFYQDGEGCLVPFIKRPTYEGVHSGQIAFPGGKWELTDLNLGETALREAEEEIGVDRNKVELIGRLTDLYIPASNFMVSPFIGFTHEKPEFRPDPFEVERIITFPLSDLLDQKIRKMGSVNIDSGLKLETPYFDIDQEMVWGATAMILGEFMQLWENSRE
ncbi:CoA pyrophosphatase [Rhodonellum sp.]|uniref:NUDIX hydrolase n=1 Tax=Rhodonellum sp. TaxID=2231180 RepID=UPI00271C3347|nr:CoA pyrophosphatase [Rhodonellum sp.]MDO9551797.1 CoA pyrophosphatase [Rhodonellum sp.]